MLQKVKTALRKAAEWNVRPVWMIALFVLFRAVYDLVYVLRLAPIFSSEGYWLSLNFGSVVFSWACFLAVLAVTQLTFRPGKLILFLIDGLILLEAVPATSLAGYGGVAFTSMLLTCGAVILLFLLLAAFQKVPDFFKKLTLLRTPAFILLAAVCAGVAGVTLWRLYALNGLPKLTALNVYAVYDIRFTVKTDRILDYTLPWSAYAVVPFLLAVSMFHKKWALSGAAVVVQCLLYLYSGNKAFIFILPVIVFLYFFSKTKRPLALATAVATPVMAIVGLLATVFGPFLTVFSLLVRRVMALPALLGTQYVDFTNKNGVLNYAGSRIGDLFGVHSPYTMPLSNLIGLSYHGYPTNSTTGFVGAAYADFGIWGILIMILLSAICFSLFNMIFKNKAAGLGITLLASFLFTYGQSSFFTLFLSNGLGMMLVLGILYRLAFKQPETVPETAKPHLEFCKPATRINRVGVGAAVLSVLLVAGSVFGAWRGEFVTANAQNAQNAASYNAAAAQELKDNPDQTPSVISPDIVARRAAWDKQINDLLQKYPYSEKETLSDTCLIVECYARNSDSAGFKQTMTDTGSRITRILTAADSAYDTLNLQEQYDVMAAVWNLERADLIPDNNYLAVSEIVDYWSAYPLPAALDQRAMFTGLLRAAVTLPYFKDMGIAVQIQDITRRDYTQCKAAMDIGNGIPVWKDYQTFSATVRLLYGLLQYEAADAGNPTGTGLPKYEQWSTVIGLGRTRSELSGALGIYMYMEDNSIRETSWLDKLTSSPGDRPAMDPGIITTVMDLDKLQHLRMLQSAKDYYATLPQDPYVMIYSMIFTRA